MARKTKVDREAEAAEHRRQQLEYAGPWACTSCVRVSWQETCLGCWKTEHMVSVPKLVAAYLNQWPDELPQDFRM